MPHTSCSMLVSTRQFTGHSVELNEVQVSQLEHCLGQSPICT